MASCSLCQIPLLNHTLSDAGNEFCCHGCLTVYRVLNQRQELENFTASPIFQQAVRSGLISNPALLEQLQEAAQRSSIGERRKLHLEFTDLWCPSCAEVIRLVLLQTSGVTHCIVDYFSDLGSIEYLPQKISADQLQQLITALGYRTQPLEQGGAKGWDRSLWLRFSIAAFCAFNLMMLSYPIYASYFTDDPMQYGELFSWLSLGMALPVVTYCAWPLYRRVASSMPLGIVGMETLVVIGVTASFLYSLVQLYLGGLGVYFDSMAVIISFVLLGKIIEGHAKFSAKESLMRLTYALPRRARRVDNDGHELFVPLKEVEVDDKVVALTGEKVVIDGVVLEGEGAVDESLLTGESTPIIKRKGDLLMTGTVVNQGRLVFRVTATCERSLLRQIVHVLEQDLGHKSSYVRLTDTIAQGFVPFVMICAVLTGLFWYLNTGHMSAAVAHAVSVLVISCPCAIGIAVPLAESHLMQGLASLGAIVRNRGSLQHLGRESVFVFDKTGTITTGKFQVIAGLPQRHREALKGLVVQSIHPICHAITQAVDGPPMAFESTQEVPGQGLKGMARGIYYALGSKAFMLSLGVAVPDGEGVRNTLAYFSVAGTVEATITLGDSLRSDALETIQQLQPTSTLLLSGDHEAVVAEVAKTCSFSDYKAHCSPLDKKAAIEELRQSGAVVSMVGDGINDALALSAADVGISVVSAADISVQVSDILLTTERLSVLPKMCTLAAKGRRIIKQNLFWAFIYNCFGMGLAMSGLLSPIFAAFAMVSSSLIVLYNAQRLTRK